MLFTLIIILFVLGLFIIGFCVFFDQAVFNRSGTIYRVKSAGKKVALTFDDGPSLKWTPLILDELKKCNIKATFFMVGYHVSMYPEVARRVAQEGHTIANHGYAHSVMFYYTPAEIEEEIKYTEHVIREVTGVTTKLFRPPKAWLTTTLKSKIKSLGYEVILWSLNSKDWVQFDHRRIVKFIGEKVRNGDILLFHDSGNVFSREGGDRIQTVRAIPLLVKTLKERGYEFISAEELIHE